MTSLAAAVAWVVLAAEPLGEGGYRAVTLEPKERRTFAVPGLETVTGSSGRCLQEGVDPGAGFDSLFIEAECGGVRTSVVWRRDKKRITVRACAEDDTRTKAQVALRAKLQRELKSLPSVTACVLRGRVELVGWVFDEATAKRFVALETKYGIDVVKNSVELVPRP